MLLAKLLLCMQNQKFWLLHFVVVEPLEGIVFIKTKC